MSEIPQKLPGISGFSQSAAASLILVRTDSGSPLQRTEDTLSVQRSAVMLLLALRILLRIAVQRHAFESFAAGKSRAGQSCNCTILHGSSSFDHPSLRLAWDFAGGAAALCAVSSWRNPV